MLREQDQKFFDILSVRFQEPSAKDRVSRSLNDPNASRGLRFLHWFHVSFGLVSKAVIMIFLVDLPLSLIWYPYITMQLALNPSFKVYIEGVDPKTGQRVPYPYDPYVYIKIVILNTRLKLFAKWLYNPNWLKDYYKSQNPQGQ